MQIVPGKIIGKREDSTDTQNDDLKDSYSKEISYEAAKRLGDEICLKYKKAFDLLKDK